VADYARVRGLVKIGANPDLVGFQRAWNGKSAVQFAEETVLNGLWMLEEQTRMGAVKTFRFLTSLHPRSANTGG